MKIPVLLLAFPLLLPLLSCSRGVASPEELLLSTADLPSFRVMSQENIREEGGASAAEVTLTDGEVDLFHSVVVFPTESAAALALELAVASLAATGAQPAEGPGIGEDSAILLGKQGARDAASLIFRQGRVLTRLTLAGSLSLDRVVEYGRAAAAKIER